MNRQEVYEAIDSERDYQDQKWGSPNQRPKQVGSWLTLIKVHVDRAMEKWASSDGDAEALEQLRKVAAISVACLEQNGVQKRKAIKP